MTTAAFTVKFWGVRGSLSCPGSEYVKYGGNTSCLEVRCADRLLILDGGTGMRPLGAHLAGKGPVDADIFFTHTHLDHIIGVPFFQPLYHKESNLRIWAGHLKPRMSIKDALSSMMIGPLFPIPIEVFASKPVYRDFEAGEVLNPQPGIVVRTAPLNHPNGATGYRIEFAGRSFCYVTDCEHRKGGLDQVILDLVRGADVMVYDSTYTDEEYKRFSGWGHSTWQEGARLADAAGVKRLAIFHHDPSHDDAFMDEVAAASVEIRPGSFVATEGLMLEL